MSQSRRDVYYLPFIAAFAFIVRWLYFRKVGSPIMGGDSPLYIDLAKNIAQGTFHEASSWPFYFFYPACLSVSFKYGIPFNVFVKWLEIGFSTGTVILIYRIAARLGTSNLALLSGILAAIYPFFLFWMPYILTDTAFLFTTSIFVLASIRFLQNMRVGNGILLIASSVLFVLSRPVAIVSLPVAWAVIVYHFLVRRFGWSSGLVIRLYWVTGTALMLVVFLSLMLNPGLQNRLKANTSISAQIGLGARLGSNNLNQYLHATKERADFEASLGNISQEEKNRHETEYALAFIRKNPGRYSWMCVKRLVAFWMPAVSQGRWSREHMLFDSVMMILLLLGVWFLFKSRHTEIEATFLALFGASFSVLPIFCHVDTDARYRLPAELLLLLMASWGYWTLFRGRLIKYQSGR